MSPLRFDELMHVHYAPASNGKEIMSFHNNHRVKKQMIWIYVLPFMTLMNNAFEL
jgi:hypothetical protein